MSVLLQKPIFEGISQKELVEQLEAKKKCKDKLPLWFTTPNIFYPNKLHIEQTSSEKTALYKSNLVSGKSLLDVSGGLGVDSYFFATKMETVYHCEINPNLSAIAQHNFRELNQKNIHSVAKDGFVFLNETDIRFDWIYVDPSRRDDSKKKVVLLQDCAPNVPHNLSLLFEKTDNILIKSSPILDIAQAIGELSFVKEVFVLAVENEVKEVLYVLKKGFDGEITFRAVNLKKNQENTIEFKRPDEKTAASILSRPLKYLYEPNAAILKAGAFKLVGERFQLQKLNPNSHLFTSGELKEFLGRRFHIESVEPYSPKSLKRFNNQKANISIRNFPLSVAEIRKKHKIKDGGETYLFFTKDLEDKRIVIECTKVKEN